MTRFKWPTKPVLHRTLSFSDQAVTETDGSLNPQKRHDSRPQPDLDPDQPPQRACTRPRGPVKRSRARKIPKLELTHPLQKAAADSALTRPAQAASGRERRALANFLLFSSQKPRDESKQRRWAILPVLAPAPTTRGSSAGARVDLKSTSKPRC